MGARQEAAYRARMGIVGILQSCKCEHPFASYKTPTGHAVGCPAHGMMLSHARSSPIATKRPGGKRFVRIRPDLGAPGYRLRVEREPGELTEIAEEKTLPERVTRVDANIVDREEVLWLTEEDLCWLHDTLGELRAPSAEAIVSYTDASRVDAKPKKRRGRRPKRRKAVR